MLIQINFKIQLESDALGTAAVTALNNDVATGTLATTFTEKAADQNEVVAVVSQILDTTCDSCGRVIEVVTDLEVSGATYMAIGLLQLAIVLVLVMLWVIVARETRTKTPARNAAGIRITQILPLGQLDLTPDKERTKTPEVRGNTQIFPAPSESVVETDVDRSNRTSMIGISMPIMPAHLGINTDLDATSDENLRESSSPSSVVAIPVLSGEPGTFEDNDTSSYHPLDILSAAALHCG